MMKVGLDGFEEFEAALASAIEGVGEQAELLIKLIMDGVSMNTKPYTPVDTSYLINSEYQQITTVGGAATGVLGYSAEYARYVHDGPQKNWQKPGASNRFLEYGLRDFIRDDLQNTINIVGAS